MLRDVSPEKFMLEALKEAEKALELDEVPVGAVIECKGMIISRAHNLTERLNDVTAHAEMQAFTAAAEFIGGKYLNQCNMYVTLEPCIMCAGAAYWTRIGKVYFGAYDQKRGFLKEGQQLLHPKTEIQGGLLEEECSDILRRFFAAKRN